MAKVKDLPARLWYMQQTLANGWSRNVLLTMVQTEAHRRHGRALTNFERLLPPPQSDLARQTLTDPYIFDFLTLEERFHGCELETNLLGHLGLATKHHSPTRASAWLAMSSVRTFRIDAAHQRRDAP
jgi:predicted nuclease of restriction endonuclease-like (RecB) superfamily